MSEEVLWKGPTTVFNLTLGKDVETQGEKCTFSAAETVKVGDAKVTRWYKVRYFKDLSGQIGKGCRVSVSGNLQVAKNGQYTNLTLWADKVAIHTFKKDKEAGEAESEPKSEDTPF